MYTHRLKWWAAVALKLVAMHRRLSGHTSFSGVVQFCLTKGFAPK